MGRAEWVAWSAGGFLLAIYIAMRLYLAQSHDDAIELFQAARQEALAASATAKVDFAPELPARTAIAASPPDVARWSRGRIEAFNSAAGASGLPPQGVLRIDSLGLQVPIYGGTGELNLNRGAGLIEGTSPPGTGGNMGLAAHRDGYFRALQRIRVGDRLSVETLRADYSYVVTDIRIVAPDAVAVLDPTVEPTVTLVTCYPFYFTGPAPQRFIVPNWSAALSPVSD